MSMTTNITSSSAAAPSIRETPDRRLGGTEKEKTDEAGKTNRADRTNETDRAIGAGRTNGEDIGNGRTDRADRTAGPGQIGRRPAIVSPSGRTAPNTDQYIHGEAPVSAGLYHPAKDSDGNPIVVFDAPTSRSDAAPASGAAGVSDSAKPLPDDKKENAEPEKAEEKKTLTCTINTDKVDSEIEKLKQSQEQIEQQIAGARNDPDKRKELQSQLQQVENELRQKDNDTYRKQHAESTYG